MKLTAFVVCVVASACSSTTGKVALGNGDGGPDGSTGDRGPADATDGSGADVPASSALPLCDGVQHLRLWVLVEPVLSREVPGSQVRVENGSPFLAVDGTCSYWINGGWSNDALSRDRETRQGMLAASEAATLEQSLSLGEISSLRDCVAVAGQSDMSVRAITTVGASAECPSTGARFDGAWAAVATLAPSLWARGTPMDGGLHIDAVVAPYDPSGSPAAYAWPTATPLSDFLLDPGPGGTNLMSPGISKLVDDPGSTSALRTLRGQYVVDRDAQPGLYTSWDGLKATDGVSTSLVYMRDAIPYEDAQGLLHF